MNFFGHAVLAAMYTPQRAFTLGAMLPDFVSMLGVRPPSIRDGTLAEGVTFHHRTDAVFHDSQVFRELSREAFATLLGSGVGRGPARAVAHVGVELLIDAAIAQSLFKGPEPKAPDTNQGGTLQDCYLEALQLGQQPLPEVEFRQAHEARGLNELCERLSLAGMDRLRLDARQTLSHLQRTLARRPRLALSQSELEPTRRWAEGAAATVRRELPHLLTDLKNRLGFGLS